MQAPIQPRAGAPEIAALHQRDDKSVLDDLALRVAAADAHDLVEHRLQMRDAAGIVAAGKVSCTG